MKARDAATPACVPVPGAVLDVLTVVAVDAGQDRRHVLGGHAVEVQVNLGPGGQRPRLRAALQGQRDGPGVVRPAARAGGPLNNYLPYDNRGAAVAPKIPDDRRSQVN